MDIQINNPGPNPHVVKAQEFLRLHSRELAAAGLFAVGCLTGYAVGKGRASGPEQEVVMASMVPSAKPKAKKAPAKAAPPKSSATAKAISKSKTTLAKAEKSKDKSSKKR